jgi:hypothetical protein
MKLLDHFRVTACLVLVGLASSSLFAAGEIPVNFAKWKHVQVTSGPMTTDSEFFEALNLDHPGLEQTKAAVGSGDYAGAAEAIARYFRDRQTRRYITEAGPPSERDPKHDTTLADRALQNIFHGQVLDVHPPVRLGDDIDWTLEPVGDREWTWCLNRHIYWSTLADAYHATGDEKYARKFNELVIDWVRKATPPAKSMGAATATWRTIECGIRQSNSWPHSYARFLHSPSFTVEGRMAYYKSVLEHARFLRRHPTGGNWLTMEMDGLLHIAILFPEFKEAAEWQQYAFDRLLKELSIQVYPDGAQFELTNSYHFVAQKNFAAPVRLALLNGIKPPAEYLSKLEKMYEFMLYSMKPNGGQPAFNDSDPYLGTRENTLERYKARSRSSTLHEISPYGAGVELFNRDDLRFAMTFGQEGTIPEHTSHAFPWAGQFIMRSGWDADACYLAFDAGPFGAGHQHEDKLGFELAAYGRSFIIDPGRYSYAASPMRHFCLVTSSHSTVMVDREGQSRRRKDPPRPHIVKEPLPNKWATTRFIDFAEGFYDEGYGADGTTDVVHRRAVVFVKPGYWVISDHIEGDGEHRLDSMFHFAPCKLELDEAKGAVRTADADQANLLIAPASTDGDELPADVPDAYSVQGHIKVQPLEAPKPSVAIIEGQEDPVQGWIATAYGKRVPAPTAIYTTTATLPLRQGYLLWPEKAASQASTRIMVVPTTRPAADKNEPAVYRVHSDGVEDWFLFGPGGSEAGLRIQSDAEMVYVSCGAKLKPKRIVMVGGTRLSLFGREEIRLKGNAGACVVERSRERTQIECSCDEVQVRADGTSALSVNGQTFDVPEKHRNGMLIYKRDSTTLEYSR